MTISHNVTLFHILTYLTIIFFYIVLQGTNLLLLFIIIINYLLPEH